MAAPPPSVILASAVAFFATTRQTSQSRKAICSPYSSTSPSSFHNEENEPSKTTSVLSTEITLPTSSSISTSASRIYDELSIRTEVTRRFGDLLFRSAVAICDYKLFYLYYGKSPPTSDKQVYPTPEEYKAYLSRVHERSASSMYSACASHGGLLVKLGQYISNLTGFIPKEYLDGLRPLQDSCAPLPFEVVRGIVQREMESLGSSRDIIDSLEESPLGSASLAQVHGARLKDGRRVAIKVQRPGLDMTTKADLMALTILSRVVDNFFSGAGFEWMLPEFHQTIAAELDFTQEAMNMERCGDMLRNSNLMNGANTSLWDIVRYGLNHKNRTVRVIVPTPIQELTTTKMLTMSLEDGFKITDTEKLVQNNINPKKVASAVCSLFSELLFVHGFVHADPHPGNLLVQPTQPSSPDGNFSVVLLDHGMYRRLNDEFRLQHCNLWAGLISGNMTQAIHATRGMGLADKYLDLLGIMLVYKIPGMSTQKLGDAVSQSSASRDEIRADMRSKFGENAFSASFANDFMQKLPRDLLFCLRCNNLVRGLNRELGGSTLDRFLVFGGAASRGSRLILKESNGNGEEVVSLREAEHMVKDNQLDALSIAKRSLNQLVASEIVKSSKRNIDEILPGSGQTGPYRERHMTNYSKELWLVQSSLIELFDLYNISLQVWLRSTFVDVMLWWKGQSPDLNPMQFG